MPTYDYHCEANNKTIEVIHRISESITTWGELCGKAEINPGSTDLNTPIKRLITGGGFNSLAEPIKLDSILPR